MRHARKLTVMVVAVAMLAMAGCEGTQARIEAYQQLLAQAQGISQQATAAINELRPVLEQAKASLAEFDMSAEERAKLEERITELEARLATIAAYKAQADEAAAAIQEKITEVLANPSPDWGDELVIIGETARQIGMAIPGVAGWWVTLAGALAAGVGGVVAGRKQQAKKDRPVAEALKQVVKGVDEALGTLEDDDADSLKSVLKSTQKPQTRALVDELRVP